MKASVLTILLFFTIVVVVLLAFFLWLYISHRTTPPSQRLALWLKSQSEADQLVETMAAQAECVLDGLRLCGHRTTMKRRRLQQRAAVVAEAAATAATATAVTPALGDHGLGATIATDGRRRLWSSMAHTRQRPSSSPPPPPLTRSFTRPLRWRSQPVERQRERNGRDEGLASDITVVVSSDWQGEEVDMDEIWKNKNRQPWASRATASAMEPLQQQQQQQQQHHNQQHHYRQHQHQQHQQQQQQHRHQVQLADLEELAEDRTWEYVIGWCLLGSLLAGLAIILCAAIQAQNDPGHQEEETHWSLSAEGDSLMDSVISHIMQIAAGSGHPFQDQWIEQGIFIYVLGVNGFLLIRQRVFARRCQYRAHLLQTLPSPSHYALDRRFASRRTVSTTSTVAAAAAAAAAAIAVAAVADRAELAEEKLDSEGEDDTEAMSDPNLGGKKRTGHHPPYDHHHHNHHQEFDQTHRLLREDSSVSLRIGMADRHASQGRRSSSISGGSEGSGSSSGSGPTENYSNIKELNRYGWPRTGTSGGNDRDVEKQGERQRSRAESGGAEDRYDDHDDDKDEEEGNEDANNNDNEDDRQTDNDPEDDTPDFRTMSFVAWFNYLQVGILVIEFMQLFSFPLRELMEFYNQVARTSAMYESAKGILNAIQAASSTVKDMANQGIHGFRYRDGTLFFGDKPLFRFTDPSPSSSLASSPPPPPPPPPLEGESTVPPTSGSPSEEKKETQGEGGTVIAKDVSPESVVVHQQGVQDGGSVGSGVVGMVKAEEGDSAKQPVTTTTTTTAIIDTTTDDWRSKMPKLDDATLYMTPWIKNLTESAEWIMQNMPRLLPNISALLFNMTAALPSDLQHGLERLKDNIIHISGATMNEVLGSLSSLVSALAQPSSPLLGLQNRTEGGGGGGGGVLLLPGSVQAASGGGDNSSNGSSSINDASGLLSERPPPIQGGEDDIVLQVVNGLGLQPSINSHDWFFLRFWSCVAVVVFGWFLALFIHAWNRRSRALLRAGKPYWPPISIGWISYFIPVVSQAIHAYAHERLAKMEEQAWMNGQPSPGQQQQHPVSGESILNQFILALLDPASTVSRPATSLLCTDPKVHPQLYMAISLLAYMLAHVLFMVFLTSFERQPVKGEICFRPNGVAILKNLGLLLAVDFLLIQAPSQRRFRGLVSIAIMLAMACYTIKTRPCYWNKINYWRTFSFSCVLYASLLVALLCPSPIPDKVKGQRVGTATTPGGGGSGGRWVMAPNLDMGHAWLISGGPKVVLAWIAAGWVLLIIVFIAAERIFLRSWARKRKLETRQRRMKEEEDEEQQRQQQQQQQQQQDQLEQKQQRAMHLDEWSSRGERGEFEDGGGVNWLSSSCPMRTNGADHDEPSQKQQQKQQQQQQREQHGYSSFDDRRWESTTPSSHGAVAFPTYQPQTLQRQSFAMSPSSLPPPSLPQGRTSEPAVMANDAPHHSWKEEVTPNHDPHNHTAKFYCFCSANDAEKVLSHRRSRGNGEDNGASTIEPTMDESLERGTGG
ncbi:hypothetical protein DFQ26_001098 [Actinomortierella ambigua]|nr:hypothetical protein DFQ26_001098 [Actinomortierella ambigua]